MERKSTAAAGPVLEVKNLSVSFRMYDRGLEQYDLKVISNLNLDVRPGEIVAVAGSSGSGKSLLAHAVMGLLPENASVEGEISYGGKLLEQKDMERLRGKEFALVPQSVTFLDPSMKVGPQVTGPRPSRERRQRQREVFDRFHLAEAVDRLDPVQLSGGMARRVLVSTAVLSGASLILADEGRAVVLITHDIDLAFQVADRVAVFYAGTTVETAPSGDFLRGPEALRHPYSKALWNALPQNGFQPVPGFQPYAKALPKGCLFAPRCPWRTEECGGEIPMRELRGGMVRCIHAT